MNLVDPDGKFAISLLGWAETNIFMGLGWWGLDGGTLMVASQTIPGFASALAQAQAAAAATAAATLEREINAKRTAVANAVVDVTTNILIKANCRSLIEGSLKALGLSDHAPGEIAGILGGPGATPIKDIEYDKPWYKSVTVTGDAGVVDGVIWLKPGAYDEILGGRLIHEAFHVIAGGRWGVHEELRSYFLTLPESIRGKDVPADPTDSRWLSKVFANNCL